MTELAFMVCMRVDELEGEPMPGSTTTACVECGCDIWVAPESRKLAAEKKAMPLCSKCAVVMAETHDSTVQEFGTMAVFGEEVPAPMQELLSKLKSKADRYESHELEAPEWLQAQKDVDHFEGLKVTAKRAEQAMTDPREDWGSLAMVIDYDGHAFPPIPVGEMLSKGIPKHVVAHQLLPALVHAAGAERVIIGLSSWTLAGKEGEGLPVIDGPISEHPDREEMLVLIDITADGVQNMSHALITRDGVHGPKLGEWQDTKDPKQSDGLFVEAIIPALKLIKDLRTKSERGE